MPRRKPRVGWKPEPVEIELTDKQRKRLQKCGLPAYALPAVEGIARRAIAKAKSDYPSRTEMRAALEALRRKIAEARAALEQTDAWTKTYIDIARGRRDGRQRVQERVFLTTATDDKLADLEAAIETAGDRLDHVSVPKPTALAIAVARDLKLAFEVFNISFDRTKSSPAAETLLSILDMVERTSANAVDHYLRKVLGE